MTDANGTHNNNLDPKANLSAARQSRQELRRRSVEASEKTIPNSRKRINRLKSKVSGSPQNGTLPSRTLQNNQGTTESRPDRRSRQRTAKVGATAGSAGSIGSVGSKVTSLASIAAPPRDRRSGKSRQPKPTNLSVARRRNVRRKTPMPLLYLGRLAIVGLGIAAIGGTVLKVLPGNERTAAVADTSIPEGSESKTVDFAIPLNQETAPLKAALQDLPNRYPNLTPKAFYIDVDTGDYVSLDGGDTIAAASTIKLPILLAFFEEVDAGRITTNQMLELLPHQVAEGSGGMQFIAPGTQFTALEVATQMIVDSDNTATNMMIDLLGGMAALNERFKGYGLAKTQISASLPDLPGDNTTSAKDLVNTMLLISGDRLTLRSRDRILNILNRTYNKDLLADGMAEKEALTYNKTGDIESVFRRCSPG